MVVLSVVLFTLESEVLLLYLAASLLYCLRLMRPLVLSVTVLLVSFFCSMTKASQKEIPTFYQIMRSFMSCNNLCLKGCEWVEEKNGAVVHSPFETGMRVPETSEEMPYNKRLRSSPSVALWKSNGSWLAWWSLREQENNQPINRQKASQDRWCLILSLICLVQRKSCNSGQYLQARAR